MSVTFKRHKYIRAITLSKAGLGLERCVKLTSKRETTKTTVALYVA